MEIRSLARQNPRLSLHSDVETSAATSTNHFHQALAGGALRDGGQSQLTFASSQERFHLSVALETFRHACHRIRYSPGPAVLMVAQQQPTLPLQRLPALDKHVRPQLRIDPHVGCQSHGPYRVRCANVSRSGNGGAISGECPFQVIFSFWHSRTPRGDRNG